MPYKKETLQAAVDFQPLAQLSSTVVPDFVIFLQHKRVSAAHPLPSLSLHRTRNKQIKTKIKCLTSESSFRLLLSFNPSPINLAPLFPTLFLSCNIRVRTKCVACSATELPIAISPPS